MKKNAFEQICELNSIIDENLKVETACKKFLTGECSAHVIRLLFKDLSNKNRILLMDTIYREDVRKNSMLRLPPRTLALEIDANWENQVVCGVLGKYHLLDLYASSKTENKFYKFRKVLGAFEGESIYKFPSYIIYKGEIRSAINRNAMNDFLEEMMFSRGVPDVSPLNLPLSATMGVEIECVGATKDEIIGLIQRLRRYDVNYLDGFLVKYDGSVKSNDKKRKMGAEIVSDVMCDDKEDWTNLRNACLFLKAIGVTSNKSCGGHVHYGSNILGVDKNAWETFMKVWQEAEPLIYMISNRRGEKTRSSAKSYAKMSDFDTRYIECKTVRIKNNEDLYNFIRRIDVRSTRYTGLNLMNIGNSKKDTIEFRLSNGTVDYNIWRENILLYGRMLQMAKMHSIDPRIKQKEFQEFFEEDLPEKEKMKRFLNLVFEAESEKDIFYKRWQHIAGETPVFGECSVKTYQRQSERETIKDQIAVVAEGVSKEHRIAAMETLIGVETRKKDINTDEIS